MMFGILDAIIPWLIGLVTLVVAIGGAWFHGKSTGKTQEIERETRQRLEQAAAVAEAERRAPRARAPRLKRLRDGTA